MTRPATLDARAFTRALLDAASRAKGVVLAEVFLRSMRSWRCEIDRNMRPAIEDRSETGFALRVWDREGREGFVHADAPASMTIDRCVRAAVAMRDRAQSGCLTPKLPDVVEMKDGDDRTAPDGIAERNIPWAEEAMRALGLRASAGLEPRSVWIERGVGRTWVLNNAGGDISHPFSAGSLGIRLVAPDEGAFSTIRYVRSLQDDPPDPATVADRAVLQAETLGNGEPPPGEEGPVLLSSEAAAIWLQWLVPFFIKGRPGETRSLPAPCARTGFRIVDRPNGGFDGEGRPARDRVLVRDGVPADPIVDSRDPFASPESLGPMRRDSYRDAPYPWAMRLVAAGGGNQVGGAGDDGGGRDPMQEMGRGVLVTSLVPRISPGSALFLAEARGFRLEQGKRARPVARCLLRLPGLEGLGRVVSWGTDSDAGSPGLPTETPSLLLDRAEFVAL